MNFLKVMSKKFIEELFFLKSSKLYEAIQRFY